MGERKGVNKYYPPDYDPSKGGLNKWQGTHALRERAKKLHLGILIIRFEMPYNIWCDGCENHIGTGVRYNAEKKKVGMYYTTPVYEFRMKCHLCDNYFEIKTDPANLDYEITSGARRQERRWDPSENEQVAPEDKAVGRKMAAHAMFCREHGAEDQNRAKQMEPVIRDLEDFQESRWEDDFSANQLLRQRFRASENAIKAQERKDAALNINVALLPPSAEDARAAALLAITMKPVDSVAERQKILDSQSVFAKLKPKRLSKAAKKDIAKQSINNIVAASTQNFNTFTNTFDKRLSSAIRIKKTKHKSKDIEQRPSENNVDEQRSTETGNLNINELSKDGFSNGSSNASCCTESDISGESTTGSISQLSSPFSDRSLLSPSPDTAMENSCHNGKLIKSLVRSTVLPIKPTTSVQLPSVTFADGKDMLHFVDFNDNSKVNNINRLSLNNISPKTNMSNKLHDLSDKTQESPVCNSSSDLPNFTVASNLLFGKDDQQPSSSGIVPSLSLSGMLVDYSGSESE